MAAKKTTKKTDSAKKGKQPGRKRVAVRDLNTKKDPKGAGGAEPDAVNIQ